MPFTIGPKIHNVIPASLKALIHAFFACNDWKGLYLSGGTCLAEYYFGHRVSRDMDLFTQDKDLFVLAGQMLNDTKIFPDAEVSDIRRTPYLAQFLYRAGQRTEPIKIDLMLDIPVRLSDPLKVGSVYVDSLDDMLANKIGCLVQRNEIKDYLDLYRLIPTSHLTAREIVASGQKKDVGLDPLILAHQIGFILSSRPPEPALLGKTDWSDLQLFFEKFQKECLELIRP